MRNGGGPACLRLRVALTDDEAAAMHQGVLMTEELYATLVPWVERHYRDRVEPKDLADPQLAHRMRRRAGRTGTHARPARAVRLGLRCRRIPHADPGGMF